MKYMIPISYNTLSLILFFRSNIGVCTLVYLMGILPDYAPLSNFKFGHNPKFYTILFIENCFFSVSMGNGPILVKPQYA